MNLHKFTLAVLLLAFAGPTASAEDPFQFLYSDMSFNMPCDPPRGGAQDPRFETQIESFLRDEGFKVLNYRRLPPDQFELRIVGLSAQRQVVEFNSLRNDPRRYSVLLWIEPLQSPATELEEKLQRFATNDLKCGVRFVQRQKNDHRSVKLFNYKVDEINELLKQLDRADMNRRT